MYDNYMPNETFGCVIYLIFGIITIAFIVWMCVGKDEQGTLYLVGSDAPVCTGTLHTTYSGYGNNMHTFYCDDGRVIKEVTNFILK